MISNSLKFTINGEIFLFLIESNQYSTEVEIIDNGSGNH